MIEFLTLEQGSPEWKELRRTRIGASNAGAFLNCHPYKNLSDVYNEMQYGEEQAVTAAMARGSREEKRALQYINDGRMFPFHPSVAINSEYPFLMASLDGVDFESKTVLEIKTPGSAVWEKCTKGVFPDYWRCQIQLQLAVTGYKSAILMVWNEEESIEFIIHRDEVMIAKLIAACQSFYENNLLEFIPPGSGEMQYDDKTLSEEWEEAATNFLHWKKEMEKAKELCEAHRELLIQLSDKRPSRGCGIRVTPSKKKGAIDYAKVPGLKGVDLNQYRNPPTQVWSIYETKSECGE